MAYGSVLGRNTKPQFVPTFAISGPLPGDTVTVSYGGTTVEAAEDNGVWYAKAWAYGNYTVSVVNPNGQTKSANVTVDEVKLYEISLGFVYGAEWAGTSATTWTRTDAAVGLASPSPAVSNGTGSSPFDNIYPWKEMKRVIDPVAGELVEIPKFYYKLTQTGVKLKIQISGVKLDEYYCSPAHMDRGDGKGERDVVCIGRYHCASDYTSKSGVKPIASITRATARQKIHELGETYWQNDFAMRFTIWLLYLVEFADWNSQTKIGYGCGNNTASGNMGYTDNMGYHTGTVQANRNTYGFGTQYRYIEGLWDNVFDWCDGFYGNGVGWNIILNPNNFSDNTNGAFIGAMCDGYPTVVSVVNSNGAYWMLPTKEGGSYTTYIPDVWYATGKNIEVPCLYTGGNFNTDLSRGLFFGNQIFANEAHGKTINIGTRLMKLP